MAKIGLDGIADPALLRKIWKKSIRPKLRAARMSDFVLAHDPLECIAFDYDLSASIDRLCREVMAGGYRPQNVELVRGAKTVGLTRPLSYPAPIDSLLFRTIVARAERDLGRGAPRWARFGRADTDDDGSDTPAESGWFRAWLERQAQLWVMTGTSDWLVETDIANFFPYIDVGAVAEHVLANSSLSEDVVRLLELMLRSFAPMRSYRPSRIGGLPQEPFDSSRILAHAYLKPVDEAFRAEGEAESYSRWVDDIVVGASSWQEAIQQVRRAQDSLEQLGLYPNAVKTRILLASAFAADYMKDENDYLGVIQEALDGGKAVNRVWFRRRLREHVIRRDRPKAWGRVLRRYYTLSRRLGEEYLLRWWPKHLEQSPDSARNILDYVATYQLTESRLRTMQEVLSRFGGVYEDLDLLAREAVVLAPNTNSAAVREAYCEWALNTVDQSLETNPRLASGAILVIGKHGEERHLDELDVIFRTRMLADSPARQQSIVVLAGAGRLGPSDLTPLLVQSMADSVQQLQFLIALLSGDKRAVGIALSGLQPVERRGPDRWVIRPRMLFLAPLVRSVDSKRWGPIQALWERKLKSNTRRLRDASAERWLAL
jgi:hypothetical protein